MQARQSLAGMCRGKDRPRWRRWPETGDCGNMRVGTAVGMEHDAEIPTITGQMCKPRCASNVAQFML